MAYSYSRKLRLLRTPLYHKLPLRILCFGPHSNDGRYNCKSGYRFLKEEVELDSLSQQRPSNDKQVWKGIWALQVPRKIKNLFWRACRNAMPTKENLV